MSEPLPKHLGGHSNITWIDEGVLKFLMGVYAIHSMLDVGCGPGGMVELAMNNGIWAMGVDGDFTLDFGTLPVVVHDFCKGPIPIATPFDLGWSVEFLEHIEEKYLDNVFSAFGLCRIVCCTASTQTSGGGHRRYHKNCQPREYWRNMFAAHDFEYLPGATEAVCAHTTMPPNKYLNGENFIQATGMVYRNTNR